MFVLPDITPLLSELLGRANHFYKKGLIYISSSAYDFTSYMIDSSSEIQDYQFTIDVIKGIALR